MLCLGPRPPTGLRLHEPPRSDGVGLEKHIVLAFSVTSWHCWANVISGVSDSPGGRAALAVAASERVLGPARMSRLKQAACVYSVTLCSSARVYLFVF